MKRLFLYLLVLVSFVFSGEVGYLLAGDKPLASETIFLFHFDEGKGDIARNSSPYHNDGVLHNMDESAWVEGKEGKALKFDGVDDKVVVPDSPVLQSIEEIVLEFWVKVLSEPMDKNSWVIVKSKSFAIFHHYGLGTFDFRVWIDGAWRVVPEKPVVLFKDNDWHHLRCTYSSRSKLLSLYVDGKLANGRKLLGLSDYSINLSPGPLQICPEMSGREIIIDELKVSVPSASENVSSGALDVREEGGREAAILYGSWDILPSNEIVYPPKGKWEKILFQEPWLYPTHWKHKNTKWGEFKCAWFRKKFTIPSSWKRKRIKVKFHAVSANSYVYLNGKKVGENYEAFCPFEFDVTESAKAGKENELLVGCEGPEYGFIKNHLAMQFGGPWQKVEVISYPYIYIKDVFVKPSVREKTLALEITLKNEDKSSRSFMICNDILDKKSVVKSFRDEEVSLSSGEEKTVKVQLVWQNPILWFPDNPHLYVLKTVLKQEGKETDVLKTRFGFREVWTEGKGLYLNGAKIRLKNSWDIVFRGGKGFSGEPYSVQRECYLDVKEGKPWKYLKDIGFNSYRSHAVVHPPVYFESADEQGMLIIAETSLYCTIPTPSDEKGWLEHIQKFILTNRNHPSIIVWSLSNETGGGRLSEISFIEKMLDASVSVDSTRPALSNGVDTYRWLYPGNQMIHDMHSPWLGGISNPPNYFYTFIRDFLDGKTEQYYPDLPKKEIEYSRKPKPIKPLFISEHHPRWFQSLSCIGGDDIYEPSEPGWTEYYPEKLWMKARNEFYSMAMNVYRELGVSLAGFYNPQGVPKEVLANSGLFIREYDSRFYEKENIERNIVVWNETYKEREYDCTWKLKKDDNVLSSGENNLRIEPGEIAVYPLSFSTPLVKEREMIELEISLVEGGRSICTKSYSFSVFPQKRISVERGRIALFDPLGKTEGIFKKEKIRYQKLKDIEQVGKCDVLVFGYHSFDEFPGDGKKAIAKIADFVSNGGRVVVFEQKKIVNLFPAYLRMAAAPKGRGCYNEPTICFLRHKEHPILKGLERDDLKFWRGDNIVSTNVLYKPTKGNFYILADSGGPIGEGLVYTPLLEMFYGKGSYVSCQIGVTEKYDKEPVAEVLFHNMIDYSLSAPETKVNKVGTIVSPGSFFSKALKTELRVIGKDADTGSFSNYDILIISGDMLGDLQVGQVRDFVLRGGKVYLHAVTPEDKEWVGALLEEDISFLETVFSPVVIKEDELTQGLAMYNLDWQLRGGWGEHEDVVNKEDLECVVKVKGGKYLTLPEGLVKISMGRGEVVIDQFLWEKEIAGKINRLKALNYISILFTNLGIPMESMFSPRPMEYVDLGLPVKRKPKDGHYPVAKDGFIREWLLCGPFPNPKALYEPAQQFEGYEKDYFREKGGELGIEPEENMEMSVCFPAAGQLWKQGTYLLRWKRHSSNENKIDLLKELILEEADISNPTGVVGYAACYVYSPKTRRCFISIGSDDAEKCFLNHRYAGGEPARRGPAPDQDMYRVILNKGYNLLILKVDQTIGGWALYCRFLEDVSHEEEIPAVPISDISIWF